MLKKEARRACPEALLSLEPPWLGTKQDPRGKRRLVSRRHLVVGFQMAPLGNLGSVPQRGQLRVHLKATLFILGGNRQCSLCFPWLALQALFFLPGSHKNHLEMLIFSHAQAHPKLCGPGLVMACPVTLSGSVR